MLRKPFWTTCFAFSLLFLTLSCQDAPDPVQPVDPQMARPPKPPPDAEPEIQEFWVYDAGEDGKRQCIHFVASGTFIGMGVNVLYDHFFNGFQDLYDHYEYYFIGGPPRADTEFKEDGVLGTLGHEDICFNGERDSSAEPFKYLPDYLATNITIVREDGEEISGYDPISLAPAVVTYVSSRSSGVKFFRPEGVISGGKTFDPAELTEVTSIWDHDPYGTPDTYHNPQFYVTWKGAAAAGNLSVADLSISNVSCTSEFGRGKDKGLVVGTTVSLTAAFKYGVTNPPSAAILDLWAEGHILVRPSGATESMVSEHKSAPRHDGSQSYSWTFDEGLGTEVDVEFVVDYLFGTGSEEAYDYVYNPSLNGVFTTAGYDDAEANAWDPAKNVSSKINDGKSPVAHSGFTPKVKCQ